MDQASKAYPRVWVQKYRLRVTALLVRFAAILRTAQLLKVVIQNHGLPMGTTKNGADWCTKALHPSDPLTEVRGIPDLSGVPSLLMNYQSTFTLSPSEGSTGTWSFDASLLPHPINFMYVNKVDTAHVMGLQSNFMNSQMAGTTHSEKWTAFRAMVQRWRLAYMSVTVYQDGPDLANQGTIVVSQPPVAPLEYNFSFTGGGRLISYPKVHTYTDEDKPSFATSQAMPNAYFGRSREGAYVPLKLTETCQDWVTEADKISISDCVKSSPYEELQTLGNSFTEVFPHISVKPARFDNGLWEGGSTSPMLNGTWAHISARNLAITTSFSFFVRCGIEMQVAPSSVLSPQLKLAPEHDEVALQTYFAIARVLKDGYPADHNDLGKIWNAISSAAKPVLKMASMIPGLGPLSAVGSGMFQLGDRIAANRAKRGRPSVQSKSSPTPPKATSSAPKRKTGRKKRRSKKN